MEEYNAVVGENDTDSSEGTEQSYVNAYELQDESTPSSAEENSSRTGVSVRTQVDAPNAQAGTADAATTKQERMFTQAELDAHIRRRIEQERKNVAYQIGRDSLSEVKRANEKLTDLEAAQLLRKQRAQQRAASYKGDTAKFMEDMLLERDTQPTVDDRPADNADASDARTLASQLVQEQKNGTIPYDFDLAGTIKDPVKARQFLNDRKNYGTAAAVELARRNNFVNASAPKAQALPRSITTNNGYKPNVIDYGNMTSEEFRKAEERIKRASANGQTVRL